MIFVTINVTKYIIGIDILIHLNILGNKNEQKRAKTSQVNIMRFYIRVHYVINLIKQIVVYGNIQNYVLFTKKNF